MCEIETCGVWASCWGVYCWTVPCFLIHTRKDTLNPPARWTECWRRSILEYGVRREESERVSNFSSKDLRARYSFSFFFWHEVEWKEHGYSSQEQRVKRPLSERLDSPINQTSLWGAANSWQGHFILVDHRTSRVRCCMTLPFLSLSRACIFSLQTHRWLTLGGACGIVIQDMKEEKVMWGYIFISDSV